MKRHEKIIPLLLILLCAGLVSAFPTLGSVNPEDNWDTSDRTPILCATFSSNSSNTLNMTMFVSQDAAAAVFAPFGDKVDVANNSEGCITVNVTLNRTKVYWFPSLADDENTSINGTAQLITISTFGSVIQVTQSTSTIFGPLSNLIIAIMPIIIGIVIIGFLVALLTGVFDGVTKKF